jgi:hypothetical protein
MPGWLRHSIVIVLFNALLVTAVQLAAPAQPKMTDRNDYEFNGRTPLQAFCPNSIYCYRTSG